jgi:predicted RNA methylase
VLTRADNMTRRELAAEEARVGRTVAAHAMVRAMLARDTWTMARILDRWATGPGTEGMDFAAAVAGAGAALAIDMAAGNRDRALAEADDALAAALARQISRVRAA